MPKIDDCIYGKFQFNDPLLVDLYNSQPVQRLQNIHQAGASYLVKDRRGGSRLDHSLGVMFLIRMLGGTVEEQAAGLLHDISHTAFSHVIDHVFDNRDETFHEAHKEWLMRTSGLHSIVEKHGFSLERIMDDHLWKILEQPQPDLCADRIDYTLRDLFAFGAIKQKDILFFLKTLTFQNNKVGVTDTQYAHWFTEQYFREVTELFMDPLEMYANNFLASVLKQAYKRVIISTEDMLTCTDEEILNKIRLGGDEYLIAQLEILNPGLMVEVDDKGFEFHGFSKPRYIDPLVFVDGNVKRLSTVDDAVFVMRDEIRKRAVNGIFVKRVSSQGVNIA